MSITLTTANKQTILIQDLPVASGEGGEGSVHRVISPSWYNSDCVKLYFNKNRTTARQRKVDYMVKYPPPNLNEVKGGGCAICWPKELVYQGGHLAGFVMPLAFSGSVSLAEICNSNMDKMSPIWRQKYDRASAAGIESRLKLCVNIAAAVNLIHRQDKYVLVDLKPQNLLVTSDGKVSIIDMDSIQIANNGAVVFPAQFATPEYVPAEGNKINPSRDFIPESWDRFSMAVMFYQILFGLHPYAASFKGQYQDSTSISDSIKNGLFVFGARKSYVHVKPRLHENFGRIPFSLQDLFMKAFDAGYVDPGRRPRAEEWGRKIFEEIQKPVHQWRGLDTAIPKSRVQKPSVPPLPRARSPRTPPSPIVQRKPAVGKTAATSPSRLPQTRHSGPLLSLIVAGVLLVVAIAVCGQLGRRTSTRPTQAVATRSAYVNTTNLNLRSGPGVGYPVLMILPQGTQVSCFNDKRDADRATWVRVRVGSQEGWVNQQHLR
jgi:serine/threonine protein kinase